MNYQFKINIDKDEYRAFLQENPYYCFTQLPEWAEVKSNWKKRICGLYDENGKLVAGAMLLIQPFPLSRKVVYSPRGFVLPYHNKEILKAFVLGVKDYVKEINAISVKIDPFIVNEKLEGQDNMRDFGECFTETIENLQELGFTHHGFGKELGDYFQPRFNMAIPLYDENGAIDKKKLLKSFSKGARTYIGNYQKNRGVFFETGDKDGDLSEFVHLLSFTEKRQGINLRNEEYFKKILTAFGDRAKIYYAKIDLNIFINYLQKSVERGENIEKNQKLIDDAKKVLSERGSVVPLSTGLLIFPRPNDQIKIAEYLYAGTDLTIFPNLSTPNGLVYASACDAIDLGCDYYNLGGVDGDLKSPLAIFKQKFAPHTFEFVGEFDLILDKFFYFGFEKCLPLVKKLIKKLKGRK